MRAFLLLLNGPQTFGKQPRLLGVRQSPSFSSWRCSFPGFGDGYTVGTLAHFGDGASMRSACRLIWGYGGMLSFGQTAFFGLAGYSYGVIAPSISAANYGYPGLALLLALVIAAVLAFVLGRLHDIRTHHLVYSAPTASSVTLHPPRS